MLSVSADCPLRRPEEILSAAVVGVGNYDGLKYVPMMEETSFVSSIVNKCGFKLGPL